MSGRTRIRARRDHCLASDGGLFSACRATAYPVVEVPGLEPGGAGGFKGLGPATCHPQELRAPPYRGGVFRSGRPERRQVDGVAQLDGEATRPDLPDQMPIMAFERAFGDAVKLGGFPSCDFSLEFKWGQISRGCGGECFHTADDAGGKKRKSISANARFCALLRAPKPNPDQVQLLVVKPALEGSELPDFRHVRLLHQGVQAAGVDDRLFVPRLRMVLACFGQPSLWL
jgi:hypothetical protein